MPGEPTLEAAPVDERVFALGARLVDPAANAERRTHRTDTVVTGRAGVSDTLVLDWDISDRFHSGPVSHNTVWRM